MEDRWLATSCQCHLQGCETELRVKAVRELPAEHVSGEQIHDRHQVEKSLLQRSSRPALSASLGCLAWHVGAGFGQCMSTLVAWGFPPDAADRDAFPAMYTFPVIPLQGSSKEIIDPVHDAQHRPCNGVAE